MRSVAIACAVALASIAATPPAAPQERRYDETIALKDWVEGPVRYIARKNEVKTFKSLESDDQRSMYIDTFWHIRDPDPTTLSNPYRHMFWERVKQANDNFIESSKPGWKTDRGKIHILYGPPTEIQEDITLRTPDSVPGGGYGLVRWIYDRPGGRVDMDATVVVAFVRDGGGEYRVTNDPNLNSIFFDANAIRMAKYDLGAKMRAESMGGGRSELSVMLDLGKLQEVPPEEEILLERVETSETFIAGTIEVRVDRYWHPDRGKPVAVITTDLSATAPEARPSIIARLAPVIEGSGEVTLIGEDSFKLVQSSDGVRLGQGHIVAEPGEYILTVMVADPVKVETRLYKSPLSLPARPDSLQVSDVVAADALEALEFRSLASYDEPYVVGPFRVIPRVHGSYRPGETVRVFFEVYGASSALQVAYQVEGQELDGSWVALGQPSVAEREGISHGWEFVTGEAWPLGRYRVRIRVEDQAGEETLAELPFELTDGPEG